MYDINYAVKLEVLIQINSIPILCLRIIFIYLFN